MPTSPSTATQASKVPPPGTLVTGSGFNPGYVLVAPESDTTTYLIDKKGDVHHHWTSDKVPGMAVYLLPNGNLLRAENLSPGSGQPRPCGYPGGRVAMYDWHGKLLWHHDINSDTHQQTHDVFPMPNGNVLVDVWEFIDQTDPKMRTNCPPATGSGLWSGMIVELQPTSDGKAVPVWHWRFWDHLLPASAQPASLPQKLDVNYLGTPLTDMTDWIHMNAVAYNDALDQIVVSSRNLNEIYIIEHSSSSEIAAGSTGGRYGRGGDFLYRWGNPAAYGMGSGNPQQFFGQHSPHWLHAHSADAHKILVNNDGYTGSVSSCVSSQGTSNPTSFDLLDAPFNPSAGNYGMEPNQACGPVSAKELAAIPSGQFQCTFEGSVQLLHDGNLMISSGLTGILYELAPSSGNGSWEVAWQFNLSPSAGGAFRCRQYSGAYIEKAMRSSGDTSSS